MTDNFSDYAVTMSSPADDAVEVTPSDTADIDVTRGINVATAGDVKVTTKKGTTTVVYIAAGIAFPIRASRIWSTDTGATGIVALY
jgi:hypothetical protein